MAADLAALEKDVYFPFALELDRTVRQARFPSRGGKSIR